MGCKKKKGKRKLISAVTALIITGSSLANAQTVENDLAGLGMSSELAAYIATILPAGSVLGNNTWLKARNQANSADLNILKVDAGDDTMLNADTGDVINIAVAATPEVRVSDDTITYIGATGVLIAPTGIAIAAGAASTPNSTFGANGLTFSPATKGEVYTVYIATPAATPASGTNDATGRITIFPTAAANAAANLAATPVSGAPQVVCNTGPNAVRLKAGGAATINGSSAGAYIPLATKTCAYCVNSDGTDWQCGTLVVPTPAGP